MFVIWRGFGLLALTVWAPVLASCAGLGSVEPRWLLPLALAVSFLAGGAGCVYYGTRWNRAGGGHSLYFVPLQAWGWAYIAIVALCGGKIVIWAVLPGLSQQGDAPALAGIAAVASAGVVGWLLVRALRPPAGREPRTTQEWTARGPGSRDPWD